MIRCPKCDADVTRHAVRCPLCATPLGLKGFLGAGERSPDPIVDPLLDYFERDEVLHVCSSCGNEFRDDQKVCRRCRVPLIRERRSVYRRRLHEQPIRELAQRITSGPPPVPRDLVRVRIAPDLEAARAAEEELRGVAVEAWLGSDTLDPFDTPLAVGIYVRAADRDAATYIVAGIRPQDPFARPAPKAPDPRAAGLARAQGYLEIGKFRDAARLATSLGADAEAAALAATAQLRAGRLRDAEATLRAAEASAAGPARGRLSALLAIVHALGLDGTPFARGADPKSARERAAAAVRLAPRDLFVLKVDVEILAALGDRAALRAALARLEALNPNLLAEDGPFRDLRNGLPVG